MTSRDRNGAKTLWANVLTSTFSSWLVLCLVVFVTVCRGYTRKAVIGFKTEKLIFVLSLSALIAIDDGGVGVSEWLSNIKLYR